jgi:hypothetical protein
MRKTRSKKTKWLNDLAVAYHGSQLVDEDFVWEAYTELLREAAIQLGHIKCGDDPIKYEKRVRIAMMNLHQEVADHKA